VARALLFPRAMGQDTEGALVCTEDDLLQGPMVDDPPALPAAVEPAKAPVPGRADDAGAAQPLPGWPAPGRPAPAAPVVDFGMAAAAQEMRVGLAEIAKLDGKTIPALQRAAYQGETNMAHLEARAAIARVQKALAAAERLAPVGRGMQDNTPIAGERGRLRTELHRVWERIAPLLDAIERNWAYQKRAAEEKAKAAARPKDTAKHAAVPGTFDLGKCDPGRPATEDFPIFNLVDQPATIDVAYTGDPAITVSARPASIPPMGHGANAGTVKLLFQAPEARGTHRGTIAITYRWPYDVPAAETFHVPVVAHAMYPYEQTDDERAAEAKAQAERDAAAQAEESEDARQRRELAEFSRKNPHVETDSFQALVLKLQGQMTRLATKQEAGITLAERQVEKFQRKLPPKASHLWWDVAMFALDVASAGIAGRVGKGLEVAMKKAVTERYVYLPYGGGTLRTTETVKTWSDETVIAMFVEATKEAIKGGSKRARGATKPGDGDGGARDDGDKNKDAAALFFLGQRTALADLTAVRSDGIVDAAAALRPLVARDEAAALAALQVMYDKLHAEGDQQAAALDQAQASIEAWVTFLAQSSVKELGSPVELHKVGDGRDFHPVRRFDGVIDIGFTIGAHPTDPVRVTSARMTGVSDTVAARFASTPLLGHQVTVRAYGRGGGDGYAEIPITVVRYADGRIEYTQEDMGTPGNPRDYLSRKIHRRGSAAAEGARKLIEEEIMSRSLAEHGVRLEHDHRRE
jgi:hypothetical protein